MPIVGLPNIHSPENFLLVNQGKNLLALEATICQLFSAIGS